MAAIVIGGEDEEKLEWGAWPPLPPANDSEPIVFGGDRARSILRHDFWRRNGTLELWSPKGEEPPQHYVAGDWRDAYPPGEEEEYDDGLD